MDMCHPLAKVLDECTGRKKLVLILQTKLARGERVGAVKVLLHHHVDIEKGKWQEIHPTGRWHGNRGYL